MKEDIINGIRSMLIGAGRTEISLNDWHTRPSFQKDGKTFRLFSILIETDGSITLSAVRVTTWFEYIVHFTLDATWRATSLERFKSIVSRYLEDNLD